MSTHIDYEDNAFFINLMIRLLKDAQELEITGPPLAEWMFFTLKTIEGNLKYIQSSLLSRIELIDQSAHIANLIDTWRRLRSLLQDLESSKLSLSQAIPSATSTLRSLALSAEDNLKILGLREADEINEEGGDTSMVSMNELNKLLEPEQ